MDVEQQAQIERVSDRIGHVIVQFCRKRLAVGPRFYMQDLVDEVTAELGLVAPDSPGRILRMLRAQKKLDYVVVKRSSSLYEVVSVAP